VCLPSSCHLCRRFRACLLDFRMDASTAKSALAQTNSLSQPTLNVLSMMSASALDSPVHDSVVFKVDGGFDIYHSSKALDLREGSEYNFSTDKGPLPRELPSLWTKKPDWRKPVAKSLCSMAPIREESEAPHEGGLLANGCQPTASPVCGDFRMQVDDLAKTASDMLDQRMSIQSGASDLEWQGQALIKALGMCRDIAGYVGKIASCMEAKMDLKCGDKELSDLSQIFAGSLRAESEARSLEDVALNQELEDLCAELKCIHIPGRLADLEASRDMAVGRVDQCVALLQKMMTGEFEAVNYNFQRRLSALEVSMNDVGGNGELTRISNEVNPSDIDALAAVLQVQESPSCEDLMPKIPARLLELRAAGHKLQSPVPLSGTSGTCADLWRALALGETGKTSAIQF